MLFNYQAVDQGGTVTSGSIDAINRDVAISSLQRRGLTISAIDAADGAQPIWKKDISLFARISNKDIVILSRQIATLFEAQVSALHVFRLLATETPNPELGKKLTEVADDLQGGNSISNALGKHPKAFSSFYVGMVRAGEESGKLDQTFSFLADYPERSLARIRPSDSHIHASGYRREFLPHTVRHARPHLVSCRWNIFLEVYENRAWTGGCCRPTALDTVCGRSISQAVPFSNCGQLKHHAHERHSNGSCC